MLAAHGADDVLVLGDKSVHLLKRHGVHVDLVMLLADELIGAVTRAAGFAVEQGVGEARNVAGRDPRLRVHDNGGVETDVVRALLHELLEPRLFDVVLELHAERAVVPGIGKAAVDLAACVDKAAVLAERYDLVHGFLVMLHISFLSPAAGCRRIKIMTQLLYHAAADYTSGSANFYAIYRSLRETIFTRRRAARNTTTINAIKMKPL